MRSSNISAGDLNPLRPSAESDPDAPSGDSYKDLGAFKTCGAGPLPDTLPPSG
jgi:hypothetical protein